jgi:arabinogalactan oligomer/maltooligosaccharide transport system substrate-binding protein
MRVHLTLWLTFIILLVVACTPITPSPSPFVEILPSTSTPSPTATPPPPPTATATPAPVRLVLWENLPPSQASALAADVQAFEGTQPYYTIDIQHYDATQVLMQAVRDETVDFHLALGDASLLGGLQAQDDVQPVDELFAQDFLASFLSPALTGATRAGHIWGLPDTAGMHLLLFYNRDLIAVPPANTEELYATAQSFTQEGRWGLAMNSYDPLWVVPWLWAYGGWLTDSDGNPTLDIPPMVNALTLYLGWHGRLTGVAPVVTHMEARKLFLSGEAAMLIDGEWAIGELSQTSEVNWGVAPLPSVGETGQPAAPLVVARYWMIKSNLPKPERDAAAAFIAFITTPERQLYWTSQFGLLPTRVEALKDPAILTDPYLRASAQQVQSGRGLLLGVDANQILDAMRDPVRAVLEGDMAPDEAAQAMQAALE